MFRFFTAQKLRPVKNDWVLQIEKDKADVGLEKMADEDIKKISKQKFKTFLKTKINQLEIKEFKEVQKKQSKTKNLMLRNSDSPTQYILSKNCVLKKFKPYSS